MNFQHDMHLPFGNLKILNAEKLSAGKKVLSFIEEFIDVIIIPLSGSLVYKDSLSNKAMIETNQIGVFSVQEGMAYELVNVSESAEADFVQLWLKSDGDFFMRQSRQQELNLPKMNSLVPVFANKSSNTADLKINNDACCFMGVYNQNKLESYNLKNSENGLFIFVLDGKFKFQSNLVQARERISLTENSVVDFQLVSSQGSFLLLEIPL
ncbi:MAG TPA: hypothetical protein PKN96_04495 [Flavobacterium sp.]|uniref:pirin family protein n=1 Tax=Flavobacterium sp. TaxID=239 RepID=UPI002CDD96C8|nr:hypothetical protein [Flavobacterium sp.]HNP32527.1 hypothetical protein [Flavobacterium sp.]